MSSSGMRGLTNFIKEIRDCPDKQIERERVKLELAKFQQVFNAGKSMGSYQRKKYVCKILYIFMLGYRVDIGRREAVQLCGAKKFSEKQVGYLAVGVLIHDGHELMNNLIDILQHDLESSNYEIQSLAVTAIANIGGRRLAQQFGESIINIMMSQNSTTQLKKKSSVCLLRLLRQHPDIVKPEFMMLKIHQLLGMYHLGVLTSVTSLLLGLVQLAGDVSSYEQFVPRVLEILDNMVLSYVSSSKMAHYEYFGVPNPWLQINLLRFLSYFPIPSDQSKQSLWVNIVKHLLFEQRIPSPDESSRYITAKNAVLVEVFDLAAKLDSTAELKQMMFLLSEFMGSNSNSLILIAIEKLHSVLMVCNDMITFAVPHHKKILSNIGLHGHTIDVKIVEILFLLCASEETNEIVQGLLGMLGQRDPELAPVITERLLILAERGMEANAQWYAEIVIRVLSCSGAFVPDPNVQQFIQTVINDPYIQPFAATLLTQFCTDPDTTPSDSLSLATALILRHCGSLVSENEATSPMEQIKAVTHDYENRSPIARQEIVETLKVFQSKYDSVENEIAGFFKSHSVSLDRTSTYMNSAPGHSVHVATPTISRSSPTVPNDDVALPRVPSQELRAQPSPFALPENEEFRILTQCKQGVLLQNEHLQIGIIRECTNAQVKMTLYYGNLGDSVLSDIEVSVNNPDMNALVFDAEQPPDVIQARQQVPQSVTAICAKEFAGAAQLSVCFKVDGRPVSCSAPLPVVATSFTSNYPVAPQDFLAAWNQINGSPLENQAIWKTTKGFDVNRVREVLTSLQLSIISGVDDNPNNLVATCLFNTSTQKVPVLFRIESDVNTQMYRVTTKCYSGILSASLSALIKYFVS